MKLLRTVSLALLVLFFAGCGMDFQKSSLLGLKISQATYYRAMEAIDQADIQRGEISQQAAIQILRFDQSYRASHNTAEELVEQWTALKDQHAGKDHLERLELEIRNYTALAARTAAEFISFLRRLGIYERQN